MKRAYFTFICVYLYRNDSIPVCGEWQPDGTYYGPNGQICLRMVRYCRNTDGPIQQPPPPAQAEYTFICGGSQ